MLSVGGNTEGDEDKTLRVEVGRQSSYSHCIKQFPLAFLLFLKVLLRILVCYAGHLLNFHSAKGLIIPKTFC